jgi:hypothetical protein
VKLVIADTGPINYLLLIGHVEILPALFEKVILPSSVKNELTNPETPVTVRNWISAPRNGWKPGVPEVLKRSVAWAPVRQRPLRWLWNYMPIFY